MIRLVARRHPQWGAQRVGELRIAFALLRLVLAEFPVFEGSGFQVLAEEDVKSRIDVGQGLVANEDHTVKFLQDVTGLGDGKPAIRAA